MPTTWRENSDKTWTPVIDKVTPLAILPPGSSGTASAGVSPFAAREDHDHAFAPAGGLRPATWVVAASDSALDDSEVDLRCPGVDDQDAIANEFWAVGTPRGTLLCHEGTYQFSDQLLPPDNIEIRGMGAGTVFVPDVGVRAVRISEYSAVRNVMVDGSVNGGWIGIQQDGETCWVEGCYVLGCDTGIASGSGHCIANTVIDNDIGITANFGQVLGNQIYLANTGIYATSAQGLILANNKLRNITNATGGYGIRLVNSDFTTVIGNDMVTVDGNGIDVDSSSVDGQIIANHIRGAGAETTNTFYGIRCDGDRFNIQGNQIRPLDGTTARLHSAIYIPGNGNDNLVTNNDVKNAYVTTAINDAGTGTITAAGNRV